MRVELEASELDSFEVQAFVVEDLGLTFELGSVPMLSQEVDLIQQSQFSENSYTSSSSTVHS